MILVPVIRYKVLYLGFLLHFTNNFRFVQITNHSSLLFCMFLVALKVLLVRIKYIETIYRIFLGGVQELKIQKHSFSSRGFDNSKNFQFQRVLITRNNTPTNIAFYKQNVFYIQVSITRRAMYCWHWISSHRTLLLVYMKTGMRRKSVLETR